MMIIVKLYAYTLVMENLFLILIISS